MSKDSTVAALTAAATPDFSRHSATEEMQKISLARDNDEASNLQPSRLFPHTPQVERVDITPSQTEGEAIVSGVISSLITKAITLSEEEKLRRYADDSSDDEKVKPTRAAYNIDDAWDKYTQKGIKDASLSTDAHKLPFIVHALGVELLYQQEVTARYGVMRRKHLGVSAIPDRNKRGKQFFEFIQREAETELLTFLKTYYPTITPEIENDIKLVAAETSNQWEKRLTQLGQSREWLKQTRRSLGEVAQEEGVFIPPLQEELSEPLAAFAQEIFLRAHSCIEQKQLPLHIPAPALPSSVKASPELEAHIKEKARATAEKKKWYKEKEHDGRLWSPIKKTLDDDSSYSSSCFENALKQQLYGKWRALLQTSIDSIAPSLVGDYTYDLQREDSAYAGSISSPSWKVAQQFPELKAALLYSPDRLFDDGQQIFPQHVKQHAYGMQPFNRRTLSDTHIFKSNDGIDLLANIRLHKRSETRAMHNYADDSTYREGIIRTHNAGDIYLKRALHQWQLADGNSTLVEHGIQSNLGQGDHLPTGGDYPAIFSKITEQRRKYNFTDPQLAVWVRGCLNGEYKSVDSWVSEITQLIIGVEGRRNPGALITNHMMLDLIEAGRFTWERAFNSREMPMAPLKATATARKLHSNFNDYMPHDYQYRGVKEAPTPLIQSEDNIAIQWLNMKCYADQAGDKKVKKWAAESAVSEIANLIRQEFPRWFAAKNIAQGQAAAAVQGR